MEIDVQKLSVCLGSCVFPGVVSTQSTGWCGAVSPGVCAGLPRTEQPGQVP